MNKPEITTQMLFKIRSKHFPANDLRCNTEWPETTRANIIAMIQVAQEQAQEQDEPFTVFSGHYTIATVKVNGEIIWGDAFPEVKQEWIEETKRISEWSDEE
jgi:hypothetical protein